MRTDSSQFEQFTLGIEEEFQIVDPNTRELRSHVSEILEGQDAARRASQTGNDPVDDRSGYRHLQRHKRSSHRYHELSQYPLDARAQEGAGDCRCRHSSILTLAGPEDLRECKI